MKTQGNIKKAALFISGLILSATVSLAQGRGPCGGGGGGPWESAEEKAQFQTERMKTLLDLTEEQQLQVQEINLKYAQEAEEARKKMDAERQKRRDAKQAELEKILTAEQIEKFQLMRPMRRGQGGRGRR